MESNTDLLFYKNIISRIQNNKQQYITVFRYLHFLRYSKSIIINLNTLFDLKPINYKQNFC